MKLTHATGGNVTEPETPRDPLRELNAVEEYVLVRIGTGGVLPDGTTNHPPIDFTETAASGVEDALDVEALAEAWGNVMDGRRLTVGPTPVRLYTGTTTPEDWQVIAAEYAGILAARGQQSERLPILDPAILGDES